MPEFVEAEIERNPLLNKSEGLLRPIRPSRKAEPKRREQLSLDDSSGLGKRAMASSMRG
ncbi:MAG: hypothetical protein R3C04_07295 [Hyphomonas sp.]